MIDLPYIQIQTDKFHLPIRTSVPVIMLKEIFLLMKSSFFLVGKKVLSPNVILAFSESIKMMMGNGR